MRRLALALLILLVSAAFAEAQEFKKFRLGIGVGYAMAAGEGSSGGVLVALEPGYRITDKLLVSLRVETAAIIQGISGLSAGSISEDAEASAVGSGTLNAIYYFSNNKFRPYVGFGGGMFVLAAVDAGTVVSQEIEAENKIGFYPRIGFDLGHFNVNLDYNIIPNTELSGGLERENSYIGIKIGAFLFGGRK